jgi:hypothetical protein
MKLNIKAFALSIGLMWGFGLFFITWWIIMFEGATGEITLLGQIYRGFNISPTGSLIGFIWGFADGVIGGAILAWLYNKLSDKIK